MARSYSETITLNCPNCSQPFGAGIWLIVDTAERPDLVERIYSLPLLTPAQVETLPETLQSKHARFL